jgi:hypothetical protein
MHKLVNDIPQLLQHITSEYLKNIAYTRDHAQFIEEIIIYDTDKIVNTALSKS